MTPSQSGGVRDLSDMQRAAARAKWSNLNKAATKHMGMMEAGEGDVTTVHFPNQARAAGFYDEMISGYLVAKEGRNSVQVRKPGADTVAAVPNKPKRIAIDVVSKGSALIVAGNHQARVGRDGNRFYVEDADTEQIIGYASTYRGAAKVAAKDWGLTDVPIELDHE